MKTARLHQWVCTCVLPLPLTPMLAQAADPIVIADFEGDDYGALHVKRNRRGLEKFSSEICGQVVRYITVDLANNDQSPATVSSRFLIDRRVVESFWNGGEAAFCTGSSHTSAGPALALEGAARIE